MKLKSKARNLLFLKKKLKKSLVSNLKVYKCKKFLKNSNYILQSIKKKFNNKVAIRSSFSTEDNINTTAAGKYKSYLNINSQNLDLLNRTILKVISSKKKINNHDEFFIQEMCKNISLSGVVFVKTLKDGALCLDISYSEGDKTDIITKGIKGSHSLIFYSNKNYRIPKKFAKLFNSIKEIKKIYNYMFLDIEFAIDKKGNIFILQVRELIISKNNTHNETKEILYNLEKKIKKLSVKNNNLFGTKTSFGNMPDWNPAEMIGTKPKPLAFSLYKELITDHIWSKNRLAYGYMDLDQFNLMTSFYGSPYIDTRIDFNSWIPINLNPNIAEKIVNHYQKKFDKDPFNQDKIEFNIISSCITFSSIKKINNNFFKVLNKNEIKSFYNSIKKCTLIAFDQIEKDIELIKLLPKKQLDIDNCNMHEIAKIYWLVEDCKKYGTLAFAGLARCGFIGIEILNSLKDEGIISELEKQKFLQSITSTATELNKDFNSYNKSQFLKKYGHLRPDTYEITSLNYKENYNAYFNKKKNKKIKEKKINNPKKIKLNIPYKQIKKIGLNKSSLEISNFIRDSIYMRENSKFVFSKSIDLIFKNLIKFGKKHNISRDDLAYLDIKDIIDLYSNLSSYRTIKSLKLKIKSNKKLYNFHKKIQLPDVISKNKDLFIRPQPENKINFLSDKVIQGQIMEINKDNLINLSGKIVCIKNADPGYDFLFNRNIKGLVTCYGGLNSHMAIRCNELNMPALIGVGTKNYDKILNNGYIYINCNTKKVSF